MTDEWGAALTAEYTAIFAYGIVGAQLSGAAADQARAAEAAHRARRDELILRNAGSSPTPIEPAYQTPFPVTDRDSAIRLAAEVEERTAAIWRAVLPVSTGAEREQALAALVEYAVQATRWRQAAGIDPAVPTWPGRPS
ncbi:ferritin-like domain-containing protein [Solwaraspora sp. WMMD406]|uniref:ferritin-like domain-containing protein n=1 Tax=Solwaraspora sp. WMMD406 TaxID=3016095 RepID=UPI002416CBCF|nr:ferritin-like domain-containing protein [Solwaraspora sp. WMMD406]MDG4767132.1 ferritin-like domain-containing protein [Solwaraspora sp. WMMD406]